ncbi:hypothetical protein AAMO2058_001520700 [Amorphochlora amoebiformis]
METFHGLTLTNPGPKELVFPDDVPINKSAGPEEVQRLVATNVLTRVFGQKPSLDLIKTASQYFSVGLLCVLGKTAEKIPYISGQLNQVAAIRDAVFEFARSSPAGKLFVEKATAKGWELGKALRALKSISDGVLFAGFLGTGQLTTQTLDRIRYDPITQLPLYTKNPRNYLKESARVSPPVTSVTHVIDPAKKFALGAHRKEILVPAGATQQTIITTANRDPTVFGGTWRSKTYANAFDPDRGNLDQILSWNGIEANVMERKGPRWCLGHDLSLDISQKIIDVMLPSSASVPPKFIEEEPESSRVEIVDSHEFDQLTGAASLVLFVVGIIFVALSSSGPVANAYCHCLTALTVNRLGIILDQPWLEVGARVYEAGALYIFRMAYARKQDKKGPSLMFDYIHIILRAFIFFGMVWGIPYFLGTHPAYLAIIANILCYPARLAMIYSFYEHWKADGWLLSEVVGILAVLLMYLPFIEVFLMFFPNVIKMAMFSAVRLVFNCLVGVPITAITVIDMDSESAMEVAERNAPDRNNYEITEEDRRTAEANRRIRNAEQRGFRLRFGAVLVVLLAMVIGAFVQNRVFQIANGQLCPFGTPEGFEVELCDDLVLRDMDIHTRFMYILTHYLYAGDEEKITPQSVALPEPVKIEKKFLKFGQGETLGGSFLGVVRAEREKLHVWTKEGIKGKLTIAVHQYMNALPLVDIDTPWPSLAYGKKIMELAAGNDLPPQLTEWEEMHSDKAIARICFAGLFAHRLEMCAWREGKGVNECAKGAKYLVDFTFMHGLEVRSPFERYGAAAFFDENRTLIGMFWSHEERYLLPNDEDWEHVKWAFKCTGLVAVTVVDHLVGTHLMMANFLTIASKRELGINHPIRRLLDIHTYNTIEINASAARTLCMPGGLVHHASSLTAKSLLDGLHLGVQTTRADSIGTIFHQKRMFEAGIKPEEWEFGADAMSFFKIIQSFVTAYVGVWYKTDEDLMNDTELVSFHDALHGVKGSSIPYLHAVAHGGARELFIQTLSQFIIGVTAGHNHVGNVAEYLKNPSFMSAKIRVGETFADAQASIQAMNIAMLTGFKAPKLMGDYTHMLKGLEKEEEAKKVFNDFQQDLKVLSDETNERNAKRDFPCNAFNPERVLTSVSI